MTYGIIFWGSSPLGATIFCLHKKAIRIMGGCGNRISCRDLFRKFHILPLTSQYLLFLLMFLVQHKDLCITNMDSYNLETVLLPILAFNSPNKIFIWYLGNLSNIRFILCWCMNIQNNNMKSETSQYYV
jgi:hypothetical protein